MTLDRKQALLKALRYWAASYALVAGFLFYKASATWEAVLVAGFFTFLITVGRVWLIRPKPNGSY